MILHVVWSFTTALLWAVSSSRWGKYMLNKLCPHHSNELTDVIKYYNWLKSSLFITIRNVKLRGRVHNLESPVLKLVQFLKNVKLDLKNVSYAWDVRGSTWVLREHKYVVPKYMCWVFNEVWGVRRGWRTRGEWLGL